MRIHRYIAIVAALALSATFTACGSRGEPTQVEPPSDSSAVVYTLNDTTTANGATVPASGSTLTIRADSTFDWVVPTLPPRHIAGRWHGATTIVLTDTISGPYVLYTWFGTYDGPSNDVRSHMTVSLGASAGAYGFKRE